MRISDANKLVGRIMKINKGKDMTDVLVDIGDQLVTATITSNAARDMEIAEGDEVFAVFNSMSVGLIHHQDPKNLNER